MRYLVIEYKGSHAISNSDRDLVGYEFSDDLEYLRIKFSLAPVTNEFDWQIEKQGFSLYHKGGDLGILLIDKEVISGNIYGREIYPLLNNVIRDSQLENLLS
jgi:hypothetical protein